MAMKILRRRTKEEKETPVQDFPEEPREPIQKEAPVIESVDKEIEEVRPQTKKPEPREEGGVVLPKNFEELQDYVVEFFSKEPDTRVRVMELYNLMVTLLTKVEMDKAYIHYYIVGKFHSALLVEEEVKAGA